MPGGGQCSVLALAECLCRIRPVHFAPASGQPGRPPSQLSRLSQLSQLAAGQHMACTGLTQPWLTPGAFGSLLEAADNLIVISL